MKSPFLNSVVDAIRTRHYSIRTERTYLMWITRYIRFHGLRHPAELNAGHIEAFLTHLAVERNVSASTQNQALCALVFMYRHVLESDPGDFSRFTQAKKAGKLPVVLSPQEVRRVLVKLKGVNHLLASLMYGSGLRLMIVSGYSRHRHSPGFRGMFELAVTGASRVVVPPIFFQFLTSVYILLIHHTQCNS